jgi:hypothetical protein
MAIVVEDGTGVAGAVSYLTTAELASMAAARGTVLPATLAGREQILVKAADYLELNTYIGTQETTTQGLSWPRLDAGYDGVIPTNLKRAQYLLAIEAMNGELSQAVRPKDKIRTKVDVIYVEYAKDADLAFGLRYYAVDSLLKPLLATGSRSLTTMRA